MSIQNSRKYIVTTEFGKNSHSEIWESQTPYGFGFPFRYVLENIPEGVRVRHLEGTPGEIQPSKSRVFSIAEIEKGATLTLDKTRIKIQTAREVSPAYLPKEDKRGGIVPSNKRQLFAFGGVGRTLNQMSAVHSAYVAKSRNKPVFTVYQSEGTFKIKALLAGLKFKAKGEKPVPFEPGESKTLSSDDFVHSTLLRGWHWWRFGWVHTPEALPFSPELPGDFENEKAWFRSTLITILIFLLLAFAITRFLPEAEVPNVENKPESIVKLAPRLKRPKAISETLVEKPKVVREETRPIAPVAIKLPDKNPQKKTSPDAPNRIVRKGETKPQAPKSNAAALAQAKALKSLLGSFALNASKRSTTTNPNAVGAPRAVIGGNTPVLGQVDIKPSFGGSLAKVNQMGGGGGDAGGGSKDGAALGYSSGGIAVNGGRGGSFVAVDFGGPTVDEGLTKEEVGAVIHEHMSEVRYCHEASLLRSPKLEGKLVIDFKIGADGKVKTAKSAANNVLDQKLDECIISRLRTWQFPHPKGGVTVAVSYPFLFKILRRD